MKKSLCRLMTQTTATVTKEAGDISSVFPSLSGKKALPLPPRFSHLKKDLIRGNEEVIKASWHKLLHEIEVEAEKIKREGSAVIPSIEYSSIPDGTLQQRSIDAIRHRGVAVVRNVLTERDALHLKRDARSYIGANLQKVRAFPADNPAVYEIYWSPSQNKARAHPNMLSTQSFLSSALWHSSDPASRISTTHLLTYADRFRIRRPGDAKFALGPHTDGGSLERWEDPEYRLTYAPILNGTWQSYDPFDARHRIGAKMDLYNGAGACSMFRLFQGWLALSSTGPGEGTLKVCPLLRHATAYLILRPFFNIATNELDLDSTSFPGSVFGACQEYNETTHPHLQLAHTMISVPRVEPGDYVAWHCDTIHAVDAEHKGTSDSSVMYIPACAMTENNILALKAQREAAMLWSPPPDFPGAGGEGERSYVAKTDWSAEKDGISQEGKRAMGIDGGLRWDIRPGMSEGEKSVIDFANKYLFGA